VVRSLLPQYDLIHYPYCKICLTMADMTSAGFCAFKMYYSVLYLDHICFCMAEPVRLSWFFFVNSFFFWITQHVHELGCFTFIPALTRKYVVS